MNAMTPKRLRRQRRPVTLAPTGWDEGATGPANRDRLDREPATEFDPTTGRETPNPNRVIRHRRKPWVQVYAAPAGLTREHLAAAERLHHAAHGIIERDPLAAIVVDESRTGRDAQVALIDARRRFRSMRDSIPSASWPVIERVVIEDRPLWRGGNPGTRARHLQRLRDGLDAMG